MATLTAPAPGRPDVGPDDVEHYVCCDDTRALCGHDLTHDWVEADREIHRWGQRRRCEAVSVLGALRRSTPAGGQRYVGVGDPPLDVRHQVGGTLPAADHPRVLGPQLFGRAELAHRSVIFHCHAVRVSRCSHSSQVYGLPCGYTRQYRVATRRSPLGRRSEYVVDPLIRELLTERFGPCSMRSNQLRPPETPPDRDDDLTIARRRRDLCEALDHASHDYRSGHHVA